MKNHYYGPCRSNYDTEEEYQEAVDAWDAAEDDATEEYIERRREEEE